MERAPAAIRVETRNRANLATVAGLALLLSVRLAPVLIANFPLLDGGLFSVMASDLRANGFVLPAFTSYNDGTIPFVYPPLGLYILALIPGDPIQTERWLPLLYSYAAVGAAFLLLSELVDRRTALVAVGALAIMPLTWAIEGGGVTRGLGFALLLLTWWRVAVLVRQPSIRNGVLVGLVAGAGLLSHPSVGPDGVAGSVLLIAFRFSWKAAWFLVMAGVVTVALCLPWLLTVLSTHGAEPLLLGATAHAAESPIELLVHNPSGLEAFDPIFPSAVIGIALALRRGHWFAPLLLAVLVLMPGDPRFAAVAWALLAAEGAVLVYDTALRPVGAERIVTAAAVGLLLAAGTATAYRHFRVIPPLGNSPPQPTVVNDPAVEWWPALTGRSSPIVYFGYEWTDQWDARRRAYRAAMPR